MLDRLNRLEGGHRSTRLPAGCRNYPEWMARLGRKRALHNDCIAFKISLAQRAARLLELGATWPARDPSDPPTPLLIHGEAIRERIADDLECRKRDRPQDFEPGGPATLPMVFGGIANQHYCRDLTPEESKLRAAWKESHDPFGLEIRERLTLEERIVDAKRHREQLVYLELGRLPEDAERAAIEAWESTWAELMAQKQAAPAVKQEPAPAAPKRTKPERPKLQEVLSAPASPEQPAQQQPGVGRDLLKDYRDSRSAEDRAAAESTYQPGAD